MTISDHAKDHADLQTAVTLLETLTITERLSRFIGSPIEHALKKLPNGAEKMIGGWVTSALHKAASTALWSLDNEPGKVASTKTNKLLAAASGAVGGAFGFAALAVELPISTTLMLRAIADVARSEGFDLNTPDTKLACLEVFTLGGPSNADDVADTAYYTARAFTTETVNVLAKELGHIAAREAAFKAVRNLSPTQSATWLAALIEKVASRFGVVITEKAAAQAVPIIGAISGATLNTLFTDYYQDMARGHFIVRRLEEKYGVDAVRDAYEKLARAKAARKTS